MIDDFVENLYSDLDKIVITFKEPQNDLAFISSNKHERSGLLFRVRTYTSHTAFLNQS